MSTSPWEPDRTLTLADARAVIGACFPTIDSQELEPLGSGWEFDAFLTADDWVFRFPRRAWIAGLFEPEGRVHELVAPVLAPGIAVPKVELMGEPSERFPHRFAGHRFIKGVGADTVDPILTSTVARDIGAALGAIHSIPEADARRAGVVEMNPDDKGRREWLEHGLEMASGLLGMDPQVDQAVSWIRRLALPLPRYDGPLRFIHGDMGPDHLIVDSKTGQLTGILDWTDSMVGDPARDFAGFVTWRGWEFAEEVLRSYPISRDEGFGDRLRFMARLLSVMWLAGAHERDSGVAEGIEWVRNAFAVGSST